MNIPFLDKTRTALVNVLEQFLRFASKSLSENELTRFQTLVNVTNRELEQKSELKQKQLNEEQALERKEEKETNKEKEKGEVNTTDHIEL